MLSSGCVVGRLCFSWINRLLHSVLRAQSSSPGPGEPRGMPNALPFTFLRALSSLGRLTWTRGRFFIDSAGRYDDGRSFRLHSTQSVTEHIMQPRLKRIKPAPRVPIRFINNLDPRSIHPEDFLDLSHRWALQCYFRKEDIENLRCSRPFLPNRGSERRFPEDCRGFLYFYEDPRGRPNVSGIRFRIAQEPNQAGFDAGEDYCPGSSNEPWSYSILQLARIRQPGCSDVFPRLYQDGLVDPTYVAKWLHIFETSGLFSRRQWPSPEYLLMSFDDPFEVELSAGRRRFYVFDSQKLRLACFTLPVIPFFEDKAPYKGRCVIRLENLKLDENSTSNGSSYVTFNIRVLKTLTPIECTIPGYKDILPPEAGSLISRSKGPMTRRPLMGTAYQLSPGAIDMKMRSEPKPAVPGHQISTLNPEQLEPCDHLNICEGAERRGIWTSAKAMKTIGIGLQERVVSVSNGVTWEKLGLDKYALGKKGFLYFQQSHPHNPMSGSIRFRLAKQPSVDAFHQGENLINPLTGSAWELTLLRLTKAKCFRPLIAQLLQDGLITQEIVDKYKSLHQLYSRIPSHLGSAVLYEIGQPFVMDLRQEAHLVYFMDPDGFRIWPLNRTPNKSITPRFIWKSRPYTGQCVVRLEELPNETSSGTSRHTKMVQIRVLKVLGSLKWRDPNQTHGELPTEGSLLPLKARGGLQPNAAYLVSGTG